MGSCPVQAIHVTHVGAVWRLPIRQGGVGRWSKIGSAAEWPLALTCHFQSRYVSDAASITPPRCALRQLMPVTTPHEATCGSRQSLTPFYRPETYKAAACYAILDQLSFHPTRNHCNHVTLDQSVQGRFEGEEKLLLNSVQVSCGHKGCWALCPVKSRFSSAAILSGFPCCRLDRQPYRSQAGAFSSKRRSTKPGAMYRPPEAPRMLLAAPRPDI